MIRIIGIDPGLAQTGYGIIEAAGSTIRCLEFGTIETKPHVPTGERLRTLYDALCLVLKRFNPAESGIESLYFAKNSATAFPVAQAKGVVLLAMEQNGITVREYPPQALKQAIVGNGKAEKSQVQALVKLILGLAEIPEPDHASDALAAAICHYHHRAVM
ncbi:MAG: crossover junction endodeoxyribonuclease RuvC [Spirochaetales bacterium]|nr:MAG: crossover junction endodeoxyribonuclease RuvC [Spirochaetales bacterium]